MLQLTANKVITCWCNLLLNDSTGRFDPSLRGSLDRFGVDDEQILKGLELEEGGAGGVTIFSGEDLVFPAGDLGSSDQSNVSILLQQSFKSVSSKQSLCRKNRSKLSSFKVSSSFDWQVLMARMMLAEATALGGWLCPNWLERWARLAASSAFPNTDSLFSASNNGGWLSGVWGCKWGGLSLVAICKSLKTGFR